MKSDTGSALRNNLIALMDGQLSPPDQIALEERIKKDSKVCDEWSALLRQDVQLGELLTEERYQQPSRAPVVLSRKRPLSLWITASAAVTALCLLTWVALSSSQSPIVESPKNPASLEEHGTFVAISETVTIEREGKKIVASEGIAVLPGDVVISQKNARFEVRFTDGSQFSSDQASKWIWDTSKGSDLHFTLASGSLSASIQKQNGRAYVLKTSHARVIVVGTRFQLACDAIRTSLDMFEGSVLCQRSVDGKEIAVNAAQSVVISSNATSLLAALPINADVAKSTSPIPKRALLVTAEPLPFFAHDVALQRLLIKFGLNVELTTFDRLSAKDLEGKALVVVPSHKCNHNKVLLQAQMPVIAWHNVWHQDLGLLDYASSVDHQLKSRSVSWAAPVAEFQSLIARTAANFSLDIYSSVPTAGARTAILKLNSSERSPLVLFERNSAAEHAGRRAAFSIDVRESAGDGAPVDLSEELFLATLRWCLREDPKP